MKLPPKQVTLDNLKESSAQEVFDWIVYNLLMQNEKSAVFTTRQDCRYRAQRGIKVLRCAAGWIMTDAQYQSSWEGKSWYYIAAELHMSEHHQDLVDRLQTIHDWMGTSPENWPSAFKSLAERTSLSPEIIAATVAAREQLQSIQRRNLNDQFPYNLVGG